MLFSYAFSHGDYKDSSYIEKNYAAILLHIRVFPEISLSGIVRD